MQFKLLESMILIPWRPLTIQTKLLAVVSPFQIFNKPLLNFGNLYLEQSSIAEFRTLHPHSEKTC